MYVVHHVCFTKIYFVYGVCSHQIIYSISVYIIYNLYTIIELFLDCIRFGFELVNHKMFKMKILKMTHLTCLVIFHLKMIVCQNVNLPHTYGHCPRKHPFVI